MAMIPCALVLFCVFFVNRGAFIMIKTNFCSKCEIALLIIILVTQMHNEKVYVRVSGKSVPDHRVYPPLAWGCLCVNPAKSLSSHYSS